MIEVRNQKDFIKEVKKSKKKEIIFFDEGGTYMPYGKSKAALELTKYLENRFKKK